MNREKGDLGIMNRETEGQRISHEKPLREFIAGAIESDGVNAFLYECVRALDALATKALNTGHGTADAQATATNYMDVAKKLYASMHQ